MQISELTTYTQTAFVQIAPLMKQLSERCVFTEEKLKATVEAPNCHLYVLEDGGVIIGCATLCFFHSPTGRKASVEDVVVSEVFRGQHLGRQLVEHLIAEAEKHAPVELHLTSNPKRIVANKLYQALGFERKETNCYVMVVG